MSTSIPKEDLRQDKIPLTVYLDVNESLAINRIKVINKPNYLMIGNGTMNKHKIFGIDLLRELANSSKAAQYLLLAIKDGINFDNNYNPVVRVLGKTSTEKQYIIIGYKELLDRNLVVRVKKSHYMVNPNALIPPDYQSAIELWDSITSKLTKDNQ